MQLNSNFARSFLPLPTPLPALRYSHNRYLHASLLSYEALQFCGSPNYSQQIQTTILRGMCVLSPWKNEKSEFH